MTAFVVNISFQHVTQAVGRKDEEHEDSSSSAGQIVFFPYFLSHIVLTVTTLFKSWMFKVCQ